MSIRQSTLKVSLLDGVTAMAGRISASLLGIGRAARGANTAGFGKQLSAAVQSQARSVAVLHAKILAATASAWALSRALQAAVNPASSFQTTLLDIAQKADLSDDAMAGLGGRIRKIAKDVGRGAGDVAKGVDVLLGMGMGEKDAMGVIPTISKAATAYRAEIEDLSKASMAAMDNLGVKVAEMPRALDAMARSGKEGAFELNDQARYFASLASLGQTLGLKGVTGVAEISSALQVIRKGAGTSEEAATRLSDVFGKITSQETVKKFGKLGVNIEKNLKKARLQAEKTGKPFSAIDFVVENLNKALKGDVGNIGKIFQDKEARLGAIALMQYYNEFKRIRDASLSASGEVDKDFARRAATFETTLARFKGAAEELGIALGSRLLPPLTRFFSTLSGTLNSLDERVGVFDHIAQAAKGFAKGLGLGDGESLASLLGKLSDAVFGAAGDLEAGGERLAQTFHKFEQMGAQLRGFAAGLREVAQAVAGFLGTDLGTLGEILGTLAGYGFKLALAAAGLSLLAKSLRAVGSALLFITGLKAVGSILGMLGGAAGRIAGLGAGAAAGTAAGAAAGAAGSFATREKPRMMTPAELEKAKAGTAALSKGGWLAALGRFGLYGAAAAGLVGGIGVIGDANSKLYEGVAPGEVHNTGRKRQREYLEKLRAETEAVRREVDGSAVENLSKQAETAGDNLDGLNRTVEPQVNLGPLEQLDQMLNGILDKMRQITGQAASARREASAIGSSLSTTGGRGRSDVQQATAALGRSRETNLQDRPLA